MIHTLDRSSFLGSSTEVFLRVLGMCVVKFYMGEYVGEYHKIAALSRTRTVHTTCRKFANIPYLLLYIMTHIPKDHQIALTPYERGGK